MRKKEPFAGALLTYLERCIDYFLTYSDNAKFNENLKSFVIKNLKDTDSSSIESFVEDWKKRTSALKEILVSIGTIATKTFDLSKLPTSIKFSKSDSFSMKNRSTLLIIDSDHITNQLELDSIGKNKDFSASFNFKRNTMLSPFSVSKFDSETNSKETRKSLFSGKSSSKSDNDNRETNFYFDEEGLDSQLLGNDVVSCQDNSLTFSVGIPTHVVTYAQDTKTGKTFFSKEQKINQDKTFIYKQIFGIKNYFCFGVCDGHGANGHRISEFVANQFIRNYTQIEITKLQNKSSKNTIKKISKTASPFEIMNVLFQGEIDVPIAFSHLIKDAVEVFEEACSKTQDQIVESGISSDESGTTLCTVFILGKKLITVNLGDSRAILGVQKGVF